MLALKRINIYARDRENPTIIITYILKNNESKDIKNFKMWVRKDVSKDFEILNYANTIFYQVKIYQSNPNEKHIFRAYQIVSRDKKWENYTELENIIFNEDFIMFPPQKDYIEFHKNYMRDFVQENMIQYNQSLQKNIKEI